MALSEEPTSGGATNVPAPHAGAEHAVALLCRNLPYVTVWPSCALMCMICRGGPTVHNARDQIVKARAGHIMHTRCGDHTLAAAASIRSLSAGGPYDDHKARQGLELLLTTTAARDHTCACFFWWRC